MSMLPAPMSAITVRLLSTCGYQIGGGIIFDNLDAAKAYAERRLGTGEPKRVALGLFVARTLWTLIPKATLS